MGNCQQSHVVEPDSPLIVRRAVELGQPEIMNKEDLEVKRQGYINGVEGDIRELYEIRVNPEHAHKFDIGVHKITNQEYAIKTISKLKISHQEIAELKSEINALTLMDHPNIVRIYEYYEDANAIHIVEELVQDGSLAELLDHREHLSEVEVRWIVYEVLRALRYCHYTNIVHRDVQPSSMLMRQIEGGHLVRLGEFGHSTIIHKDYLLRPIVGNSLYIAPEVLEQHYNE